MDVLEPAYVMIASLDVAGIVCLILLRRRRTIDVLTMHVFLFALMLSLAFSVVVLYRHFVLDLHAPTAEITLMSSLVQLWWHSTFAGFLVVATRRIVRPRR